MLLKISQLKDLKQLNHIEPQELRGQLGNEDFVRSLVPRTPRLQSWVIQILGLLVSQFAASAQLPPITLRPWDKFGGIKIEDIDIEEVNRLEAAGNAARIQAFFDQQKEEAEKNDSVTLPKETEDEKIETESSEEITLSSGNETT